jgi:hypothetical protein
MEIVQDVSKIRSGVMWDTGSLWFEVAVVSSLIALGHIFLGHFEERTPKLRKFIKYIITMIFVLGLSIYFGRTAALLTLALFFLPVLYIHLVMLPKKGINGLTGEPKARYYEFRGWDKDIFKEQK